MCLLYIWRIPGFREQPDRHMWRGQRQGAWGVQRRAGMCPVLGWGEGYSKGFPEEVMFHTESQGKSRRENIPDGRNSMCKNCRARDLRVVQDSGP